MNKLIGLVLLIAGLAACYVGWQRKESLAGEASELGAKLANKIDGGARVPEHMYYLIGGGIVALIGAGLLLKRTP